MEDTKVAQDDYLDLAQLDAIPDQVLLEDGSEHEVQIIKAQLGHSKEGAKTEGQAYLMITFKSTELEDSKPFNDVFMLPFNGLEKEQFNQRGRALRTFFQSFEFEYASGWNIYEETDQLVGMVGKVLVRLEDDPDYGEQNSVRRYL